MPKWTGTIVAKSLTGIKVKDDGDWLNFTKDEWKGEPFNTNVKAGDKVELTYSEDEKTGRVYISTIGLVDGAVGGTMPPTSMPPEQSAFPPEEEFVNDPFPPPDDGPGFGPDDGKSLDASGEPSVVTLDRDRLIVRQVAAKCAVEALGPYPYTSDNSDDVRRYEGAFLYLMSYIEDLVYR